MRIEIPEFSLVMLIGSTSSGKSTFARKHFKPTEILSSDAFRGMLVDDENDQRISADAFDALYYIAEKRLSHMRLSVIDATNVQSHARKQGIMLARRQNCHCVAIVLNTPEKVCLERNAANPNRGYPEHVIRRHCNDLKRSLKSLKKEGFRFVYVLNGIEEIESAELIRTRIWNDKRDEHGPFDIIGDVHGCYEELVQLFHTLGYTVQDGLYLHPGGRRPIFLGDLCDRGPHNLAVLRLVMRMVEKGAAFCVPGNHDIKLLRKLNGKDVQKTHGFDLTWAEMEQETDAFREEAKAFLNGLVSHYVLDGGRLVVAHAGLKEQYQGRASSAVREFCIYGEVTGEIDEYGLPVRLEWAGEYRGKALVVYGHIPQMEPNIMNNTCCVDTGCVFGGRLTALRYPEQELVFVPAAREYYAPVRPLQPLASQRDDMLQITDVSGKLHLNTALVPAITVHENNAAAALEVMSRFAIDPHWLIYLPPTMSPCETSGMEEYLEHPLEAFDYYRTRGVERVVCEKKHMGSRAVIVLAKDAEAAQRRFGVSGGATGVIYTRTGRHFFDDAAVTQQILDRLNKTLAEQGFYDDFQTDWVCMDTELLPWSVKAQALLQKQYAPVGRAGKQAMKAALAALEGAAGYSAHAYAVQASVSGQNMNLPEVLVEYRARAEAVGKYVDAYREYCWPVHSIEDIRVAPFHLLAAEGKVFTDQTHAWHMETLHKYITQGDQLFLPTEYIVVDVRDEASVQAGVLWWLQLTHEGGEGMVVKPHTYIAKQGTKLLQPAVKCRGREYLRIIYGPEYTMPAHLERLKKRSLSRKRALALQEFALGVESLHRFVNNEPLYRVHECAFAVLAFESEPVDPRL